MKVIGLNGVHYNIDLKKYLIQSDDAKKKSKYHLMARELLTDLFKGYFIYEEVKLPGSRTPDKKSALFFDFFIPSSSLAVEVHGLQHYEFSKFFHKTKSGFLNQMRKDQIKREWCDINRITLIELDCRKDQEDWRKQIVNSRI